MLSRRWAYVVGGVVGAALALCGAGSWWRTRNIGAVQRGYVAASAHGCFACHGAGGVLGLEDPGQGIGGVPPFSADDVQAYARNAEEIREWILDGMPSRIRKQRASEPPEDQSLLRMPAWRGQLSEGEVDALVAYVKAVSDFEPPDNEPARAGLETARRLGCVGCHGPEGRGNSPNPGSLKGYIPSWDGADFPDLARDDGEIREWILDGSAKRLRENPLARWFLQRQVVQMPAYRNKASESDVESILAYIHWLRGERR